MTTPLARLLSPLADRNGRDERAAARELPRLTAVLVGTRHEFARLRRRPLRTDRAAFHPVGYIGEGSARDGRRLGGLDDVRATLARVRPEAVVVSGILPSAVLDEVADAAAAAGCSLLYPARMGVLAGTKPHLVWCAHAPYYEVGGAGRRGDALLAKRVLDVVLSAAGLLLLLPLLLAIAVAIRLDSAGPVLFAQRRAGLHGRPFRMLKFRTMRPGADAEKSTLLHLNGSGDPRLFKVPNDPRVTRVGAWLRRWSLDELPQLWNVLVGEMSLVGPRPFFETDLADYEAHHFRRLVMKPGVTGLWQVSGRSDVLRFDEVVRLDRSYIEGWSLRLDLSILLRTIPSVLLRRGAY